MTDTYLINNFISEKSILNGDIKADGILRIDGILKGNAYSTTKIIVGRKARCYGTIAAPQIEVFGYLEGQALAPEKIFIDSHATVKATIVTKRIEIRRGAHFSGYCKAMPMYSAEAAMFLNKIASLMLPLSQHESNKSSN